MPRFRDLTGQTFGRLTVVKRDNTRKGTYWLCECSCGTKEKSINGYSLTRGLTKSCGCYNKEAVRNRGIDLTGKVFDKLTVVKRSDTIYSSGGTHWICDCACGTKGVIASSVQLREGIIVSCGCYIKPGKHNLIGQVFGRLTVVGKSDRRTKNGDVYWICDCSCGTKNKEIISSNLTTKTRYKTLSCGCYLKEGKHLTNKQEDREKAIIKYLYTKLKVRQKNRLKLDTSDMIRLEEFANLIQEPCYYCGLEKSNTTYDTENYEHNYKNKEDFNKKRVSDFVLHHNGIDRIDSSKGYVKGNVVPCCKFCNMAKMDMSVEEFLEWANSAYNYYVLNNL